MNWIQMLWCFVTLSFLGWVFNMIHSFISEKKIYNKGFLTLPFCPSYGAGGVICYYVFHNLADNIFITFIGSALVLSVLTVICGALLNKILGCKPWDYSGMRFNIGTYLTLPNAMMLGLLGVFTVHMLVPPLNLLLNMIPNSLSLILVLIFCGMILIDFIFSLITIIRLRKRIKHLGNEAALLGTGVSSEKLREIEDNYNLIFTNSLLRKRMVNAFPELKSSGTVKLITAKLEEIKIDNMKEYETVYEKDEDKPFAAGFCFAKLFALFLIGSFLGSCIETVYAIFAEGHLELRVGIVYGPFIPVYGGGAVLLTAILYKMYKLSDTLLFVISAFLGAFFEYMCSWFQEIVLGTVSWDYSDMPLNINGRTSLMYACIWGFLGLIWVRYLYPFASKMIERIPKKQGSVITAFLVIFMIYNGIVTMFAISRWNLRSQGAEPANSFESYIDEKFDDERMSLLFPHMRYSDDLTEITAGKKE